MSTRVKIFSSAFQELPAWSDFAEVIDEVFKERIDDPQLILRLLRNTFAFGNYSWTNPNDPDTVLTYNLTAPTAVILLNGIETGYPDQAQINVYQKLTTDPDENYSQLGYPTYAITANNRIVFPTPIPAGQTIKITPKTVFPSGVYSISDLYNFHGTDNVKSWTFGALGAPATNFFIPFAAGFYTGYPTTNRIIVYRRTNVANSQFQFVPSAEYTLQSPTLVVFQVAQPVGTIIKIVERPQSVELSKKLNQLGFQYGDLDFVSLPTEYENSDVMQVMSDLLGNYYLYSKGTRNFADFFAYVFKAIFRVSQMWSYENGNDEYPALLPEGDAGIGTEVWNGGTWYPTSHVTLYYDLIKFGNTLNEKAVKDFFLYVCPINLVVVAVVLETVIDSEIYVASAPLPIIYYL